MHVSYYYYLKSTCGAFYHTAHEGFFFWPIPQNKSFFDGVQLLDSAPR